MNIDHDKPDMNVSRFSIVILLICIIIFAAFRMRWVGHLLIWDEAMSLCTIRSFFANGTDDFSNWFWRHPPLFSMLMTLAHPFKAGFAERVECLAIAVGIINLLILFQLNRKLLGTSTALWAVFFLATLPGSVFFDVWVKTDHTVTTFGLLSILLLSMRQPLYSGLCLGLAMLSKETGLAYALTVLLLWSCGATGKRTLKDFAVLTVIPFLTCGWWYLAVTSTAKFLSVSAAGETINNPWHIKIFGGLAEHVILAFGTHTGWNNPWHYYFTKLPSLLGMIGLMLSIIGAIIAVLGPYRLRTAIKNKLFLPLPMGEGRGEDCGRLPQVGLWAPPALEPTHSKDNEQSENPTNHRIAMWPLFLLIPSYLLLSLLNSKVPWTVISLLPAWATLQGLAAAKTFAFLNRNETGDCGKTAGIPTILMATPLVIACLTVISMRDYERILQKVDIGQWRGAHYSRQAAEKMNQLVANNERALITSFHYWKGLGPEHACPVFAYYFSKNTEILLRPYQRSLQQLENDIVKHQIDWALISPEPDVIASTNFNAFVEKHGLNPIILEKAVILRTTSMHSHGR